MPAPEITREQLRQALEEAYRTDGRGEQGGIGSSFGGGAKALDAIVDRLLPRSLRVVAAGRGGCYRYDPARAVFEHCPRSSGRWRDSEWAAEWIVALAALMEQPYAE